MTHLNYATAKTSFGWYRGFFSLLSKRKHKVAFLVFFLYPSVIHFLLHIFNTESDFLRMICFLRAQKLTGDLTCLSLFPLQNYRSQYCSETCAHQINIAIWILTIKAISSAGRKIRFKLWESKVECIIFACSFGSLETPIIVRTKLAYSNEYRWQCLVLGTAAMFPFFFRGEREKSSLSTCNKQGIFITWRWV